MNIWSNNLFEGCEAYAYKQLDLNQIEYLEN